MSNKELDKVILESIYTFGPLAIPEILYLFRNFFEWSFKLDFNDISKLNKNIILKNLNLLKKENKIREYLCDTGYRRRFGVSKLPFSVEFPLKLRLKIELKKCPNCLSWVIEYFNITKHLSLFSCDVRKKKMILL